MLYSNLEINNKGHLQFAGIDTIELAKQYGTPAYVMDENRIRERCKTYINSVKKYFDENSKVLFAAKSICVKEILRILDSEGMCMDAVSSGEIFTAKEAGLDMSKVYFHGNNKTIDDINYAIDCGVGYFIVDNENELIRLNDIAKTRGITQNILLRVTPGIDPHTHIKINTGMVDSKFGVAIETGQARNLTEKALAFSNVKLNGFHCHVGSQMFDNMPLFEASHMMMRFIYNIKDEFGYSPKYLNLGGGMAVPYKSDESKIDYSSNLQKISEIIKEQCEKHDIKMPSIMFEPGRSIVADSGITLYEVGEIKEIPGVKNYVSVDGGMNDNPRYTLYHSPYTVLNASKMNLKDDYICTIAGRCCESGDLIQENVFLPKPMRGDIIAVLTTGAYNYSMSSNYNCITRPPIVIVKDGKSRLAVRRQTFEDLLSCQI